MELKTLQDATKYNLDLLKLTKLVRRLMIANADLPLESTVFHKQYLKKKQKFLKKTKEKGKQFLILLHKEQNHWFLEINENISS
jgi:hypothetical protein